jgi:hypothetical protein
MCCNFRPPALKLERLACSHISIHFPHVLSPFLCPATFIHDLSTFPASPFPSRSHFHQNASPKPGMFGSATSSNSCKVEAIPSQEVRKWLIKPLIVARCRCQPHKKKIIQEYLKSPSLHLLEDPPKKKQVYSLNQFPMSSGFPLGQISPSACRRGASASIANQASDCRVIPPKGAIRILFHHHEIVLRVPKAPIS